MEPLDDEDKRENIQAKNTPKKKDIKI